MPETEELFPSCTACGQDALRTCPTCGARCLEHLCEHLGEVKAVTSDYLSEEQIAEFTGQGWLSNVNVIGQMTTEALNKTRDRLAFQLYAIDEEIQKRRFNDYRERRARKATTLPFGNAPAVLTDKDALAKAFAKLPKNLQDRVLAAKKEEPK